MIVLDSSAVIDFLNGRGLADDVEELIDAGQAATNVVIRYEVLVGEKAGTKREARARKILYGIPCRPLDPGALDRALAIGVELRNAGATIDVADIFIAGIALAHGDKVLTGNREHFDRIDGLEIDPRSR